VSLPLVTVITPTYNRAGLVGETIGSVLDQDYPRIEYIVIDDGSTDDTSSIVEKYLGRLPWVTQANAGEARTVNRGFSMSAGEIIGVVNSDDPLLPRAISTAVETLSNNPDVVAVYPDWEIIDDRGGQLYHISTQEFSFVNMVRWHLCVPGPGTFFRRSVLDQVGGRDPAFRYVGDHEFWLRAGLVGPFRRIPQTLATHRWHAGSISSSERGEAMAREHVRLVETFFARPELPPEILAVRTEAFCNAYFVAATICDDDRSGDARRFDWWDTLTGKLFAPDLMSPSEEIVSLNERIQGQHATIDWLHSGVAARDKTIASLHREVAKRDEQVAALQREVAERDRLIERLALEVTERGAHTQCPSPEATVVGAQRDLERHEGRSF
jgi:glycosyltransferase involved in cell wall biosynthesis